MTIRNPLLRLRGAIRKMGVEEDLTDEAIDAVDDLSYSRRESDLKFERMMSDMRREMAEFRNQVILAIVLVGGLIIGAVGLLMAVLD